MGGSNVKEKVVLEKRAYSVPEVAQILNISRTLCYDMVREGRIPSKTLGVKKRIVPKDALDKWLADDSISKTVVGD